MEEEELFYDSELHFLQSVLKKCRVQTQVINANENPEATLDLGLRVLLGIDNHFESSKDENSCKYCNFLTFCNRKKKDF